MLESTEYTPTDSDIEEFMAYIAAMDEREFKEMTHNAFCLCPICEKEKDYVTA